MLNYVHSTVSCIYEQQILKNIRSSARAYPSISKSVNLDIYHDIGQMTGIYPV